MILEKIGDVINCVKEGSKLSERCEEVGCNY